MRARRNGRCPERGLSDRNAAGCAICWVPLAPEAENATVDEQEKTRAWPAQARPRRWARSAAALATIAAVVAVTSVGRARGGSATRTAEANDIDSGAMQSPLRYSDAVYDALAARAISPTAILERAKTSTLAAKLCAREEDLLFDDTYCHEGHAVYLGVEDGAAVMFMSHYLVSMAYTDAVKGDLSGKNDWAEHSLTLRDPSGRHAGGDKYTLHAIPDAAARPTFSDSATAYYRTLGDNDVVLVYFPIANDTYFGMNVVASLGIEDPTVFVTEKIAGATSLFDQDFVLVSRAAFDEFKSAAKSKGSIDPGTIKVAAVLVAAYYVLPALGIETVGGGIAGVLGDVVSGSASGLWADALPVGIQLAGTLLLDNGKVDFLGEDGKRAARMLLAVMPGPATVEGKTIERFLSGFRATSLQSVSFDGGVLLLDPAGKLNVNYELIAQGLARLDTSNADALARFPEFAQAAQAALDQGRGFAKTWESDSAYAQAVAKLSR